MTIRIENLSADLNFIVRTVAGNNNGLPTFSKNWIARLIQQWAWRIVSKLPAKSHTPELKISEYDINSIVSLVSETKDQLDLIWYREAKYLILGYDALRKLEVEIYSTSFGVDLPVHKGKELRVFNLTVITVPWINGAFVLPEIKS